MSNFFGRRSASGTPQVYTGIQVSTSMYGNAVPLLYGMTRGSQNLLNYGGFKATGQENNSGKGGGGSGISSYDYSAWWAGALCEGPIIGVGQIWHDRSIVTLVDENLALFLGQPGQPSWTVPPAAQQIPYDHIAYVAAAAYDFGDSPSMPNLNYEIKALLYNSGPPGPQFGGTFSGDLQAGSNIITHCSPPGSLVNGSILSDSIGAIPSGTTVAGLTPTTVTMSQPASAGGSGDTISYTVVGTSSGDADASLVIPDYLQDVNHGAGYAGVIASLNDYANYLWALGIGVSPTETTQRQANDFLTELMQITNSEIVEGPGTLRVVPYADAAVTGNSRTYTPNLTPIFAFDDDDFIAGDGEDPVKLKRKALKDTYNHIVVEYLDRANYYNAAPAEAFDLDDINSNGQRLAPTFTFHQITNANTARTVAQLLLQSSLYRRNSYSFKLRADYCQLEPMDPIAITDPGLGLVAQLCWITKITDTADNELEIECLEVTGIANTTPQYNWSAGQGYAQNFNASPGSIATPAFFMMPPFLAANQGDYMLGIAACGQSQNAGWAGCNVYMSVDGGNTYAFVGSITTASRYGTLAATFPAGLDPDTADILSLNLTNTTQTIASGTQADADAMRTLILIEDTVNEPEVVAFSAATAVGAGEYNLGTYLRRAQYQTASVAHASGTPWIRLDGTIFQLPVDPGLLGQTLYFKFSSFNHFLAAAEDLSDVPAYTYTLTAGALGPNLTAVTTGSCIAYDYHAAKSSAGAAAWDSAVYTTRSYSSFSATCMPQQTNKRFMLGVSSNPSASSDFSNADWAFGCDATGILSIYTNGNHFEGVGPYQIGDLISITYDGANLRFFHENALVFTRPIVGATYSLFMPFFDPNAVASDVTFTQLNPQQNNVTWVSRGAGGIASNGNSLQSRQTVSGWGAADVYSQQSYANGCTFSCRFPIAERVMAGLATLGTGTPGAAPVSPYSTLGGFFLWHYDSTLENLYILEGNQDFFIAAAVTVAPTDVFSVEYDGFFVRYYQNGEIIRVSAPSPGLSLQAYFTSFEAGDLAADVFFASVPQATPWGWDTSGACYVSDTNIGKDAGAAFNWDSAAFSVQGYPQAHIQAKPNSTSAVYFMFGLCRNPQALAAASSSNFRDLDYAWEQANGAWFIFESGTQVTLSLPASSPTDVAGITYDGTTITYLLNGIVRRSQAVINQGLAANTPLFGGAAFYSPGAGLNSLEFGNTIPLPVSDTGQIGLNAATSVLSSTVASTTIGSSSIADDAAVLIGNLTIPALGYPYDFVATVSGHIDFNSVSGGNGDAAYIESFLGAGPPSSISANDVLISSVTGTPAHVVQSFSKEWRYTNSSGTAPQIVGFYGGCDGIHGAGGTVKILQADIKIEVIKR